MLNRFKNIFLPNSFISKFTRKKDGTFIDVTTKENDINLAQPKIDSTTAENQINSLIQTMCNGGTEKIDVGVQEIEPPKDRGSGIEIEIYNQFLRYLEKVYDDSGKLPKNQDILSEIGITKRYLQKFKKWAEEDGILYRLNARTYTYIKK